MMSAAVLGLLEGLIDGGWLIEMDRQLGSPPYTYVVQIISPLDSDDRVCADGKNISEALMNAVGLWAQGQRPRDDLGVPHA